MAVALAACGSSSTEPPPGGGPVNPPPQEPETPVWPLSGQKAADADSVHAPYGPRALPSAYDFHAGVDIPAPRGTPVRAVLSGQVVQVAAWTGSGSAGNAITIRHPDGTATSYLHMDEIRVAQGAQVRQGAVVGTVGSTGASYPHLHLGYFPALVNNARDERISRNPLELLPYDAAASRQVTAAFGDSAVVLDVPLRRMAIASIELRGDGGTAAVTYATIVQQGATARDNQLQAGVRIEAGRPQLGRFTLRLAPTAFVVDRVIVRGIEGDVLLDATRQAPPG